MQKWEEQIKLAHQGDVTAREQMILDNIPLVWSMVARFHYANREKEELFQIGMLGLMQAVDRFDVNFGVQFSTYAVPVIMGEIRRFLRDDAPVKVTRSIVENRKQIQKIQTENPGCTMEELAEKSGLSLEDVVLALESEQPVTSIYESVYDSGDSQIFLVDKLEQKEKTIEEQVEEKELLHQALSRLDDREKQMIEMRFFENKTQTQVGKILNMSQVQISRWEKKVLIKIRQVVE